MQYHATWLILEGEIFTGNFFAISHQLFATRFFISSFNEWRIWRRGNWNVNNKILISDQNWYKFIKSNCTKFEDLKTNITRCLFNIFICILLYDCLQIYIYEYKKICWNDKNIWKDKEGNFGKVATKADFSRVKSLG